jgi:protein-tyrosine phosphatase
LELSELGKDKIMVEEENKNIIISALRACRSAVIALERLEEEASIVSKQAQKNLMNLEMEIEDRFGMDIEDFLTQNETALL